MLVHDRDIIHSVTHSYICQYNAQNLTILRLFLLLGDQRAFGEDITNKPLDNEGESSLAKSSDSMINSDLKVTDVSQASSLKPRAPIGKGEGRPGGRADGRTRAFRQSSKSITSSDMGKMSKENKIESSHVTPQKSQGKSTQVTPSAAEFESPQPFTHQLPKANLFETPMISFVEASEVSSNEEKDGLYAGADDFSKLLEVF